MKKIFGFLMSLIIIFSYYFFDITSNIIHEPKIVYASGSNDSASDAYDFGTIYSGNTKNVWYESLDSKYDERWYKFNITSPGEITFYFEHSTIITSTSTYWCVHLFQNDATTQYANQSGYRWSMAGNESSTEIGSIFIPSGTYYFEIVAGTYYSSVEYDFRVNFRSDYYCETEANEVPSRADVLELNYEYDSVIPNKEDVDWYKFTTTSNGYLTIQIDHDTIASTSNYWRFKVYSSDATTSFDGNELYYSVNGNTNFKSHKFGVKPDTYYIKVYCGTYHSSVEYRIKINFNSTDYYEKENNGTYSRANEIKINTTYSGSLDTDDLDWYKFSITDKGYFSFNFTHDNIASSSCYWKIYFYLSDGVTNLLGSNVYYEVLGNSNLSTSNIGIGSGTYYFKVVCGTYTSSIDYTFKLNFYSSAAYEAEVNNSYSKANYMGTQKKWQGNTNTSGDIDWFEVYLSYSANYTITFSHPSDGTTSKRWEVYVYQDNGTSVIKSSVVTGSQNVTLDLGSRGYETCYIKVVYYSSSSWSNKMYTIEINDDHTHNYTTYTNSTATSHISKCRKCQKEASFSHVWDEGVITKDATHLETGIKKYECTSNGCNAIKEVSINKISSHTYNDWKEVDEWTHERECSCGKVETNNHKWNEGITTLEPTCSEKGIKHFVCTDCGAEKDVELASKHKIVTVGKKDPDCNNDGYSSYSYCEICGETIAEKEIIHSSGHVESEWIVDKEPTCEEDGTKHTECKVCGVIINEGTISATGHTESGWKTDTDSTCETSGIKHTECEVCGKKIHEGTIGAKGHSYEAYTISPTCEEEGYTEYRCSCGDSYRDSFVSALGHAYSEWEIVLEPTCFREGIKERKCETCGDIDNHEIEKTNHIESEWIEDKHPSCEGQGTRHKECEECGTVTATGTINAHGHSYTEFIVQPTCEEEGYTEYRCSCGKSYRDNYVSARGHEYGGWYTITEATTKEYGEEEHRCIHCNFIESQVINKKAPIAGIVFGSLGGLTTLGGVVLVIIRKRRGF